jgi:myo-inositol 2-dehydrogenase/D-chiro-inositol 1-dehydrogenase
VVLAHCVHRNASVPPTYTSEMLVTSSLVHEIDVTRWLLGEEITAATVHASRTANGLRDPQLAVFETTSGVLVDVEVFVNARRGYEIGCELVGEPGRLLLGDATPTAGFRERFGAAYRAELQAWVDAVRGGPAFGPDAWDGYAANVVADACLESLATGARAEVRLPGRPTARA